MQRASGSPVVTSETSPAITSSSMVVEVGGVDGPGKEPVLLARLPRGGRRKREGSFQANHSRLTLYSVTGMLVDYDRTVYGAAPGFKTTSDE